MTFSFWRGKKVFITGHTGFKGSWLSLWLKELGANVTGYALLPPSEPNLFTLARVEENMVSLLGDVRDYAALLNAIQSHQPDIIFHLAAQALVRNSYNDPVGTMATNVMGTVHLLNAVRYVDSVRAVVNVTSDKCYENKDWVWGYRENDPMGGHDPYSCSKGCAELITTAFCRSFFSAEHENHVDIATARAGNVIGGGDWAEDRLVPDIIRAVVQNQPVLLRNPNAVRPWQHVLEPLSGYMILAEKLYTCGSKFGGGWNFGPPNDESITVGELAERITDIWGGKTRCVYERGNQPHEARYLKLDATKARTELGWRPKLSMEDTVRWTVDWYKTFAQEGDIKRLTLEQIERYQHL